MFPYETLHMQIDAFLPNERSRKGYQDARIRVLVAPRTEIEWPVPVVRAEGLDLKERHVTIWIKSLRGLHFCSKQEGRKLYDPIKAPFDFNHALVVKAMLGAARIKENDALADAAQMCLERIAELGTVIERKQIVPTRSMIIFKFSEVKIFEWVVRYRTARRWKWKEQKSA